MSEENTEDLEVLVTVTYSYTPKMKYYPEEIKEPLDAVEFDFINPDADLPLLIDSMDIVDIKARYPDNPDTERTIELDE